MVSLLCKSLSVWLGPIDLFLLLFLLLWGTDVTKYSWGWCQRRFYLCSLAGVWWCLVLHLSLSAILSLFSCMVWGCVLISLICMQLSTFPSNACWKNCLFPILCFCLLYQRLIDHRCQGLFLGSLFCSLGQYVCFGTSTILFWWLCLCNIAWSLEELCLLLGFVPHDCFGNFKPFVVSYKFLDCLF